MNKNKNESTVVGELVQINMFYSTSNCFDFISMTTDRCEFIYLTHFRTAVIAGNGTQRLVDMSLFCFEISLRISLRFFSAARLRYHHIIMCFVFEAIDKKNKI